MSNPLAHIFDQLTQGSVELPDPPKRRTGKYRRTTEEDVLRAIELRRQGRTYDQIAEALGMSRTTVMYNVKKFGGA